MISLGSMVREPVEQNRITESCASSKVRPPSPARTRLDGVRSPCAKSACAVVPSDCARR